jgi:hypothetical protein
MQLEFIPYEQALELKELGFDILSVSGYSYADSDNLLTQAILYQQAFRWFREKYNLKFHIREDNWNNWCSVYILISDEHERVGDYLTYEEAELECLNKLIEIVKTK